MFYRLFLKRFLDIVFSLLAIIMLIPIYFIISLLVLMFLGHPILFHQDRIGKNEEIFKLYKFRSMTNKRDDQGILLPDKERLTKFGIFLRSSSLDELPELFMILLGKMSFIGPRPQPSFYGPYYKEEERAAFKVRGGLLPPDSLCKEVQCSWETQLQYESYYATHLTFSLDVKIVLCTFLILYKRLKYHYGEEVRPHLSEYRKDMKIEPKILELWKEKGIEIK